LEFIAYGKAAQVDELLDQGRLFNFSHLVESGDARRSPKTLLTSISANTKMRHAPCATCQGHLAVFNSWRKDKTECRETTCSEIRSRSLKNQKEIIANQTQIKSNQDAVKKNQATILKNQGSLNTIIKNQKQILTLLKK
jgi:hypothetical protein